MTNTRTTPYLSTAPAGATCRSSHLLSAIRYLLSTICIAGLVGNAFAADVQAIDSKGTIETPSTDSFTAGQTIEFSVSLSGSVTADPTGGSPYLVLSGIKNADSDHTATFTGRKSNGFGYDLGFSYTVKPGD